MQFNSNSDFPGSHLPSSQWSQLACPPVQFDTAQFAQCAKITTRILSRCDGSFDPGSDAQHVLVGGMDYTIKMAKDVLVRTPASAADVQGNGATWSDSSDEDDDSFGSARGCEPQEMSAPQAQQAPPHAPQSPPSGGRAYWLRRTLRAAIYGQVRYGIVLSKLEPPLRIMLPNSSEIVAVEWEETGEAVAIKEMSWEHIRRQRDKLAEDPIKEVSAMQFLNEWLRNEQRQVEQQQIIQQLQMNAAPAVYGSLGSQSDLNAQLQAMRMSSEGSHASLPINLNGTMLSNLNGSIGVAAPVLTQQTVMAIRSLPPRQLTQRDMLDSHIMMPLDLLNDDRNLFSVMPYCSGGELFELLEKKNRFTEAEARFWFRQILVGLTCLKKAGVSHRDLSLENILVEEGNALVIDMGMCLRIPMIDVDGARRRTLILPQGVCGKWHYMSPEICKNELPFDGPTVDLWACGVILFLMLTGFPPWERPTLTDERFRYMANGYLVQMLTEWQVPISPDAKDLLQRMFWIDPADRLSLEQVCAHPWLNQ
mmetsp:Transcript_22120/g.52266  ORF Transcript_22120/g.52266 Transcript_22120/m.52266 type:complete len:535 (+) Transcript_22120:125-1729(+)